MYMGVLKSDSLTSIAAFRLGQKWRCFEAIWEDIIADDCAYECLIASR